MTPNTKSTVPAGRVVALVVGCLMLLPALGALVGGAGLGLGYAFGRDSTGFFSSSLDRLESPTAAVTAEEIDFTTDPGSPGWLIDALDADVRLRAANESSARAVFVGIASQSDVDRYLAGVAHDEVRELRGRTPVYRSRSGTEVVAPPTGESFWVVSASGPGSQEIVWPATSGRWAAVVMNADGSPGVAADIDVGVKADFVLPLAMILFAAGVVGTTLAVALIVYGAVGLGTRGAEVATPPPTPPPTSSSPVRLEAHLDQDLSRWLWLVKWVLAIPHFVVLFFLWIAFIVLTVAAGFAILFTGRYPPAIFAFNVGVLRWSWRVSCYATTGGLGTDRYPSFSLQPDDAYPATLEVAAPERLSRGLVLVKWWLLAIPHYLVVGLLAAGGVLTTTGDDMRIGGGLLSVLVLVAGASLLFRARYPRPLFDLIIGLNRWIFRVVAYAALMTDVYPPFRLDQGGTEPVVADPDLGTGPVVEPPPTGAPR